MNPRTGRSAGRSRGFTLLEALLAISIFAVAVVGLFEALQQISLTTIESAEASQVTERMRTYLTEITRNPRLVPGETETEPDAEGFIFRATIEEQPMQSETGGELRQIYAIRVQALRPDPRGELQVVDQAETLRFAPLYRQ